MEKARERKGVSNRSHLFGVLFLVVAMMFTFQWSDPSASTYAAVSSTNQTGNGYEMGGYAASGIPTWYSWTNQSVYKGPLVKPIKKWEVVMAGVPNDQMTVAPDGTSYVTSWEESANTGHLYAIGPDGNLIWTKDYTDGWAPLVPAIGKDGALYVGCFYRYGQTYPGDDNKPFDGKLEKLNPADHTVIWEYTEVPGKILNQPVLGQDGTVYFVTHNSSTSSWSKSDIFAIASNGTLKWSNRLSGSNFGYLVNAKGSYLYVVTGDNSNINPYKLCAVRKDTGKVDKTFIPTDKATLRSNIVVGSDGTVYVAAFSPNNIYALNPATFKVTKTQDAYNFGSPTSVDTKGDLWSSAGIRKNKATLVDTPNALGFSIDMLAANGYFGYNNGFNVYQLRADFPDFTEAWTMTEAELERTSPSMLMVPRDGWIYTIQRSAVSNRVIAYYGEVSAGSNVGSVGITLSPYDHVNAGNPVLLTAQANGGTNTLYKFTASKLDNMGKGGPEQLLRDYTTSATFTWKPAEGLYMVYAYAKSFNGSDEKKSKIEYYNVVHDYSVSNNVILKANPNTASKVGKSVVLTTKITGIKKPQYKFYIMNALDTEYRVMSDWSSKSSYTWKFRAPGDYYFKVEVRDAQGNYSQLTSNIIMIHVK